MAVAAFVMSVVAMGLMVPVAFALGILWARMHHAEQDALSGWQAVAESLDEVKAHLGALYRKTEVLPDGGVVEGHE